MPAIASNNRVEDTCSDGHGDDVVHQRPPKVEPNSSEDGATEIDERQERLKVRGNEDEFGGGDGDV